MDKGCAKFGQGDAVFSNGHISAIYEPFLIKFGSNVLCKRAFQKKNFLTLKKGVYVGLCTNMILQG